MNNTLHNQDQDFLHLIGKHVIADMGDKKIGGILQFAGINEVLHGQFQLTISRMPIWPVDKKSLKITEVISLKI
jgi:hypothetical protein